MRILVTLAMAAAIGLAAFALPQVPALAQNDGKKCVSLKKKVNGREVLINACSACQVVKVERARGGGALASFRTFIVQGKSVVDMPFKGPGRTRLVGAKPCSG